jgi:hypothetical protein
VKPRFPLAVSSLLGLAALGSLTGCPDRPIAVGDEGTVISRTDPIAPGATCAAGGNAVLVGHDRNANGVLDDREIESTTNVCREDGPDTLVRVDPEPAGAHCASGGSAVHTGVDRNRDGVLENDEITSTTYACDPQAVFHGDFTLEMWTDPAQVALLAQAQVVTGSIDAGGADTLSLPRLEIVGGNLSVAGHGTTSIQLGALAQVGGNLIVSDPALTGRIGFPALARVGGDLQISAPGLTDVTAPSLASIGGGFGVYACDVADLELPALTAVGGWVNLSQLPITDVPLPALETIGGSLFVRDDAQLASLAGLASLRTIGFSLYIESNGALIDVELPRLDAIGIGTLEASSSLSSSVLRSVRLPALTFARDLSISYSPKLETFAAPVLFSTDRLSLVEDPALTSVDLRKLVNVWSSPNPSGDALRVENTGLSELSLPALFESGGAIQIRRNPAMTAVRFGGLFKTESLHVVDNPQIGAVAAPGLGIGPSSLSIGEIEIDNTPVHELSLGNVATISRRVFLRGTQLADLNGLAGLTSAYQLRLVDNAQLASLAGLANLASAKIVAVTGSPALSPDEVAAFIARVKQ